MLREGPRRTADACESGDWLHVDVYLTKPLDYRRVLFAGSRFDGADHGMDARAGRRVLAVGGEVDGACATRALPHGDDAGGGAAHRGARAPSWSRRAWWRTQDEPRLTSRSMAAPTAFTSRRRAIRILAEGHAG